MKTFALFLALVSLPSFGAIIDGCYKTLSYNGQPVQEGPDSESSLSKIYSITSQYYFTQSLTPLKTKVVSIFKGFNEGWYSYINPIIFDDLGVTQQTSHRWSHQFEGFVNYASSYYSYDETDFLTHV